MHKETVFIVDDDASIRDSLSLLLSLRGYATALFANAEDFLAALQPDWRGCVVVDIRMPGMSGLELQRCLRERGPSLPVIVITAHGDVAAARQAFLADAVDFIEKPFDGKQLLGAIENALSGFRALDIAQARAAFTKPTLGQLSIREREVMTLMVKGLHNRRIAETLGISPRTVEVHKARVMEKLGAQNIVDLVRLVDKGLT
ncbi:two component transcriptional regulator, LuxR family [Rhodoferax ferrireducens T118]|uniref:Two component transcriptional regulator, LuxR family n=1 Tax=Albidiferax ferrireducens (strain ATCC BAA-621 / DSM 15236 / T118) TaxID=338969 RepID=Q21TW1_ALBFT|nr:response regulator [Rhodoferax ferrireducens]ABD70792.1 two component transcriptional regulator, LuxR family [Rhodoferax ferrireducens T118]WPC68313.1 response regulator [Rhodoferax ferrireducens]